MQEMQRGSHGQGRACLLVRMLEPQGLQGQWGVEWYYPQVRLAHFQGGSMLGKLPPERGIVVDAVFALPAARGGAGVVRALV